MSVTRWRTATAGFLVVVGSFLVWGAGTWTALVPSKAHADDCSAEEDALTAAEDAFDAAVSAEATANDAVSTQMDVVDGDLATLSTTLDVSTDFEPTEEYGQEVSDEEDAYSSAQATEDGLVSDAADLSAAADSATNQLFSAADAYQACLNP